MTDVFLSYSRKDTPFVKEIFEALSARQREAWIDLHAIEYSSKVVGRNLCWDRWR